MSDRITTVPMSRSGQLDLRCTVELNCSGMFTRLATALVTRDHTLDTCEPSCMPEAARPFFILVVNSPLGPWGTWQHRSFPLGEARPGARGSAEAHIGSARSRTEEHVAAPKLSSRGGIAWSNGTCGSAGTHLDREARSGAEKHVAASELTSVGRCGPKLQLAW
jgi:hypothetical protein